ncbi:VRR-NUC domain-containing protein [Ruegeria sp. HKCCD6109]|uniref:VRR-NUC domain-containing protein n=1 Tax=Ruegeria sp. HKCCD6109 TaxID=2683017 RepID=UPI0020A0CB35|nr:VRR-NUC domain-containing protein [Ruegeria sp. HKCCD6109]
MRATVKKKAAGQVTGFPDLLILPQAKVGAFFFEIKAEGGRLSQAQKAVHEGLRELGYPVAVVRSIEDAREALIEFGVGFREAGK